MKACIIDFQTVLYEGRCVLVCPTWNNNGKMNHGALVIWIATAL